MYLINTILLLTKKIILIKVNLWYIIASNGLVIPLEILCIRLYINTFSTVQYRWAFYQLPPTITVLLTCRSVKTDAIFGSTEFTVPMFICRFSKRKFYISAVWGSRRKQSLSEIKEIQKCLLKLRQIKNTLFLQKVIVNFYVELLKDFMADHGLPNSEKICSPKCRYVTRQWSCCTHKACIRDHPYITSAKGLGRWGQNNGNFCWCSVLGQKKSKSMLT